MPHLAALMPPWPTLRMADHAPVQVQLYCNLDFCGDQQTYFPRWDRNALMLLIKHGRQQKEFHEAVQLRLTGKLFNDAMQEASHTTGAWVVLNGAVYKTAYEFFAEPNVKKEPRRMRLGVEREKLRRERRALNL